MQHSSALFAPVVDVREVLESFLADGVLLPGWRETLAAAAAELAALGQRWSDADVTALSARVEALTHLELESHRSLVRQVATAVSGLLDDLRVPGVPRPDDENWSF